MALDEISGHRIFFIRVPAYQPYNTFWVHIKLEDRRISLRVNCIFTYSKISIECFQSKKLVRFPKQIMQLALEPTGHGMAGGWYRKTACPMLKSGDQISWKDIAGTIPFYYYQDENFSSFYLSLIL